MRELLLQRARNVAKFPLLSTGTTIRALHLRLQIFAKKKRKKEKEAEKIGIVATRKTSLPKNSAAIVDPVSRRAV